MRSCNCRAVVSAAAIPVDTLIDRFPSSGMITVSARICENQCSAKNCSISILYGDHANPSNSFVFRSVVPGIPIYEPVSGGGIGLIVSAQGEASGVIFNDIVTLSNIHFLQGTIIGDAICSISLRANGRTFEVPGCIFRNFDNNQN
ncbi:hypothetical protein [Bacillus sp. OK048]|uniref:hypothetical protein n=1 Tax=Bacillus sp. OK048 TaxID=1882761 RepID=UPI0008926BE7|nr:hypothetical protein [Bacillus sp. OK048]SDM37170.1 hypothetical protein SAMN05443253_10389 [Bacillus sp. OK048]